MSLSILIPTYNYDCSKLICDLRVQAEELGVAYEIIVGDDGSTDGSIVKNLIDTCSSSSKCRLLRMKKNQGRAGIRNMLGHEASYDTLMFMDSDAEVVDSNFLKSYVSEAYVHDVVSGTITHQDVPPSSEKMLRYEYEKKSEQKFTAQKLNKMSYPPFSSFCFMIRKELFDQVQFDESFTEYGYEDVFYGKALRESGHKVYYIPTRLQHNGMETNVKFIEKTEKALNTLKLHSDDLSKDVYLLRLVNKLHKFRLDGLVRVILKPFMKKLRNNLCSNEAKLKWFNYYKLGYYLNN